MPKQARVLVVGGGVAAAHVAQALCDRKEELPETDKALCTILSAYPSGISPYDRSRISKDALDCTRLDATSFPSLELPAGVEIYNGKVAIKCDPDEKRVTYRDAITGDEDDMTYEKLIIATGARAKVLDEAPYLWQDKHSDIADNGSMERGASRRWPDLTRSAFATTKLRAQRWSARPRAWPTLRTNAQSPSPPPAVAQSAARVASSQPAALYATRGSFDSH